MSASKERRNLIDVFMEKRRGVSSLKLRTLLKVRAYTIGILTKCAIIDPTVLNVLNLCIRLKMMVRRFLACAMCSQFTYRSREGVCRTYSSPLAALGKQAEHLREGHEGVYARIGSSTASKAEASRGGHFYRIAMSKAFPRVSWQFSTTGSSTYCLGNYEACTGVPDKEAVAPRSVRLEQGRRSFARILWR